MERDSRLSQYLKNIWIITISIICGAVSLMAHEIRPAYLQIKEQSSLRYEMVWKVPMLNGAIPKINPSFSGQIKMDGIRDELTPDALIKYAQLTLGDVINGQKIDFPLLEGTLIDVLVFIQLLDGSSYTLMAQPDNPYIIIPEEPSTMEVVKTYLILGVEHILLGYDHLLFVACLLLLISNLTMLIKAITAFTFAHSITLVGATLDWVSVPGPPVEAVIALSIVFLAREFIMTYRGESSITVQYPWIVALTFGLLHGFGFAGALGDIGLPQQDIPLALLFFNVGVELGQLFFLGVLIILQFLLLKMIPKQIEQIKLAGAYGIGGMGVYWLIERIIGF